MLLNSESDFKLSYQLSELNEKFIKSEAERNILEAKFQHLQEAYKNEEGRKLALLRDKYNQFIENCNERNIRNESILKSLQKVENGANAVFAKTERLKQLRSHYDAYLSRAMPLWRHPDALEDTGVPRTWIREPRLMTSCAHPAMLLPGGGAVMLPVQNNVSPHIYPQSAFIPRQVENKIIETKSLPSPSAKVIATLGKAGEIMMHELGMLNNNTYNYAQNPFSLPNIPQLPPPPAFYQPYQLPIYLPPAPTYYTNTTFNSSFEPSMPSLPLQEPAYNHQRPKDYSSSRSRCPTDQNQNTYIQNLKQTLKEEEKTPKHSQSESLPTSFSSDYRKPRNSYDGRKASKDNYEIECLQAETNNYDEDLNLSDDDVLDSAKTKPPITYNRNKEVPPVQNYEKVKLTPTSNSITESNDYSRGKSRPFNSASHTAKIVEVEHQKSIDELKAMLSVENDESIPDMYMTGESDMGMLGDEDVPDDFNEQNFPENHYDQRYQNDVSRNVILEEDEDEDDYPPVTTRRDDWQNNKKEQLQRNMPENYSGLDIRRNEPNVEGNYANKSPVEEVRKQNIVAQNSPLSQQRNISKSNEVSRPASGGKRSPSPIQNFQNIVNRRTGTHNRSSENQLMAENNIQHQQIQYEEMKAPLTVERVSSYQDFDSTVESRSPREPSNSSLNPVQTNIAFLNHEETQQYQNEYNDYNSSEQAEPPNMSNAYEDQYEIPSDVHGYSEQLPHQSQSQHLPRSDEYSPNYDEKNYLRNEEQPVHYRDDDSNNYIPPQQVETRDPNIEYPDQYSEQQYVDYAQEQTNVPQQYIQDNREYYSPHEGTIEESYHPQPYMPEENRDHSEPYQELSNNQYHEPPYVTEEYQGEPVEHLAYPDNSQMEQISSDYVTSPDMVPSEYQQETVEDTNYQNIVSGQPLPEEPVVTNFQPPQLDKIDEIEDRQNIPQQQSNLDIIQPLQLVEEKPRSSPQKQPSQRSPLQRRQSSLSQQSPQRQKQGQKVTQQKSQQRQSPKKSDRTQQNSPKKPQTPEPQPPPPPSVITQLIDSESESYQVEPSGQNPDDSDFDFSIGK